MPAALQVTLPVQVSSSALFTDEHVPAVLAQLWQVPLQAVLQQRPSTQMPLAHWALAVQTPPCLSRQAPDALQVLAPVQVSVSSAPVTDEQIPDVTAQVWQVPVQALLQQWPSTHRAVAHWPAVVHVCPSLARQAPEALQVFVPVQVSASSALVTGAQVPVTQLWQAALQAVLQQTPSTHIPVAHWVPAVHVCPCLARHVPEALQVLVPVQVSGSSALVTDAQVPVTQVWQLRLQAVLQQRPSTHMPDEHWVPVVHVCPCLATHVPWPLQVLLPVQVSASSALATGEQVPVAHV